MIKDFASNLNIELSVIIPCFNMGQFIGEAIDSILKYEFQEKIEIIIVNDGSDDEGYTKRIIDNYSNDYDNIFVIHQSNKGLGAARNIGAKTASAEYILFLDADNKIRKEFISESISVLRSNANVSLVYGDLQLFGLQEGEVTVGKFDLAKITIKNYIDACVVMRKSSFFSVNGYDENMPIMGYEDWDLNLRLAYKGHLFFYLHKICFDYRVRENSMLSNSNENRQTLVDYIFEKQELKQISLLREELINNRIKLFEYERLKKRLIMKYAIKLELILKKIFNRN